MLDGIDIERSAVPDLCQGVAGDVLASVMILETTHDAAFLQYAQNGAARLRALAREEDGLRVWPWPEGPFGDLSGTACYGFGHGVAGIVYALLRLHAVAPDAALLEEITRGLDTLARVARPVPGAPEACWWPVSRRDDTCWNAWCHGTPGVLKTLSLAHKMRLLDDALPHAGLRGMYLANNSELCLCHGVASCLYATLDARDAGINVSPYAHAMQHEADLLARALRGNTAEIFHDGAGLMTGPLGAQLTLRRASLGPGATESGGPAPLSVS